MSYQIDCPPSIIPNATITLIGEAPGRDEVIAKQGFVGATGKILQRICSNAGINFELCNRTNIAKRRPPDNDFGSFYKDPIRRTQPTEELQWWKQLLIAEITKYRPNVVVALGNEPLKALTDKDGVTKWHGSILTSNVIPGLKVIPMTHPSYIMRDNWEFYYINIRFMKRVAIEATAPYIVQKEEEDEFIIRPTFDQAIEFIHHIRTSGLPWNLDVETKGDTLDCFGLWSAGRPRTAICIPIQTTTGPYWSDVEEAAIYYELSLAMRDNPYFQNQNCIYDLDYMLDVGCEPSGIDFDPMIAQNVAYPEFDKGLDFTCALNTYYPYYKDEGKTWKKKEPDEKVWIYNCKDMVTTPKVSKVLKADLKEMKLDEVYRERSHKFLGLALEMQRNKLRLDPEWHKQLSTFLADERLQKHTELTGRIGRDINVKSSQQVAKLLYEELRLPIKKKRGSQSVTTDENSLKELRAQFPHIKELNLILEERHLRTKESNYIDVDFDVDSNNNKYLAYTTNIAGTKTGRWSFSTSPKWRGSSPQTIPKIMRLMYIPPEGSCFWQRDLSQAEVRIVAWLSNCQFLLDIFASGKKIHTLVASRVFKKAFQEVIQDSMEYDIAKKAVHAYDYMMGYKKLAILANVSYDFAKQTLDSYGKEVPEIGRWHQFTKENVIRTGQLKTPMGRTRQCYKAMSAVTHTGQLPDEILRDLVSYVPQSTVPDILNEGMYRCWNEAPWVKWHQQGHDSYLASGDPRRTEEFYELSERAADIHFIIGGKDCFIPGEFSWGYSWGAMLKFRPGESTTKEAWMDRAMGEGMFDEKKIKDRLYSMN